MSTETETKLVRRVVPADLIEATPGGYGVGHWLLASPLLLFLAWFWTDRVHTVMTVLTPSKLYLVNTAVGLALFVALIVLPLGLLAHWVVMSLPRLFHNAGWDIHPLEPVAPAEQYLVRYRYQARHWAARDWPRVWTRAAQGWVFLEIFTILAGAVLMIPIYFSVREFGFGQ